MSAPEIAQQLTGCGVPVFPCHDNKQPAIKGGFKSASTTLGPYWPSALIGIPIPAGTVVIDIDAHKGMTTAAIDSALGCQLDWSSSLLQNTPSGGAHHAFRVELTMRQGSDLFADQIGKGFDTRVTDRGYICAGGGYHSPDAMGVLKLSALSILPELPPAAATALTACADAQHEPTPLPTGDRNAEEVRKMLRCLDADCSRADWLRVGLALKHHYHDDDGTGWILFDNWSKTGSEQYDPAEARKLWSTVKATTNDGKQVTTLGTIVHKAIENGYVPDSIAGAIFGAGSNEPSATLTTIEQLIAQINADGGKPENIDSLTTAIRGLQCNAIQRAALTAALQRVLRDHNIKITEKELKQATNPQQQQPIVLPQPVDNALQFRQVKVAPVQALGNVHIQNAGMLRQAIFGERLARCGSEPHWWSGKCWEPVTKADLSSAVAHAFVGSEFGKDSTIKGTTNQLMNLIPHHFTLSHADKRIFFNNGVFDPQRPDLGIQPHQSTNLNSSTLAINYEPGTPHPEWDKFLMSCFHTEPERITLLQEVMGWWLISDNLNHQKAIAFDGVLRSGKGTIFQMVSNILGEALADISLGQLADNKSLSGLRRATLGIDRDSKRPQVRDISTVHSYFNKITANEPISIPLLFTQDPWHGALNCKLAIACNGIPIMADDSGAAPNRWVVIKFTETFLHREDLTLANRLAGETAAVAAWAVEGLRRLISHGKFTMPVSSLEESHALSDASSPLVQFAEERLEVGDYKTHGCELWASFKQWCADTNNRPPSKHQFLRALERALQAQGVRYKRSLKIGHNTRTGLEGVRLAQCADGVGNVTPISRALADGVAK